MNLNLAISEDLGRELKMAAAVDGVSQSHIARVALLEYIEVRKADKEFKKRRKALLERQVEALKRLAE